MIYFSSGGAPAPSPVPPEHPTLELLYRPAEANAALDFNTGKSHHDIPAISLWGEHGITKL